MKKHVFGLLLLAPAATLAEGQYSVIEAPVVGVEPLVRTVTQRIPHESCWDERVRVVERGRGHSALRAETLAVCSRLLRTQSYCLE